MAQHFSFNDGAETIIPYNAQYAFPSQADVVHKTTTKLVPRDGGPYSPGAVIRIDLPAQAYLNPLNTVLSFVAQIKNTGTQTLTRESCVRFTKNGNCLFSRARWLYGSSVLEDIQDYNLLCRMLTNATVAEDYSNYAGSVFEGLGSEVARVATQSNSFFLDANNNPVTSANYDGVGQKFTVNLALGLLTQRKLIPLKWCASSFRLELYLAPAYQALIIGNPATSVFASPNAPIDIVKPIVDGGVGAYSDILLAKGASSSTNLPITAGFDNYLQNGAYGLSLGGSGNPDGTVFTAIQENYFKATYRISQVELIAEMYDLSESYDMQFYADMQQYGIPIHYKSWHTFPFAITGSNAQYPVQERSKSLKAAFACITSNTLNSDNQLAYLFDSFAMTRLGMKQYQWRVGGKYFPAQPVVTTGMAGEAFVELLKALNMMGAYEAGCQIHTMLYGSPVHNLVENEGDLYSSSTFDFNTFILAQNDAATISTFLLSNLYEWRGHIDHQNGKHYPWVAFATGNRPKEIAGGACSSFMIGASFESQTGLSISGINGEEQNEIALKLTHNNNAVNAALAGGGNTLTVFTYFDALMVVRPGNVVNTIY